VLELGVLDLTGSSCHAVHVLQMATVWTEFDRRHLRRYLSI